MVQKVTEGNNDARLMCLTMEVIRFKSHCSDVRATNSPSSEKPKSDESKVPQNVFIVIQLPQNVFIVFQLPQ